MRWQTVTVLAGITLAVFALAGADDPIPVPVLLGTPDQHTIPWPDGEPATAAQIDLGRQLFFDPRLSRDGTMSCATCHDPAKGLADGLSRGVGVHGDRLARNTPGLTNVAWGSTFFWDGRAESLETQALGPITNPIEMDMPRERIVPRLERVGAYRSGFAAAYPGPDPASGLKLDNVLHAIASFERTLVSRASAFDRYAAGERTALSPEAQRGMALFAGEAGCVMCHRGPRFTNDSFQNIGLPDQSDPGRAAIMRGVTLHAAFKTPSLRNVALTAPYFHDGSAATLEEVVSFYSRGSDDIGINPLVSHLDLSLRQQRELVAFLRALSDPITVERPILPLDDP